MSFANETITGSEYAGSENLPFKAHTFWDLIEKLLLNTTRDEQSRHRRNAALSALCQGHAVRRVPREIKQKKLGKSLSNWKCFPNQTFKPNSCKECYDSKLTNSSTAKIGYPQKSNKNQYGHEAETSYTAKQVKSECLLNNLDVEYLDKVNAPASERLWRYAIKNRKKNEKDKIDETMKETTDMPSVRSNEAIYLGLRKRMEDALVEKELIKDKLEDVKMQNMRSQSCTPIPKFKSDVNVVNKEKPVPEVKRTCSVQSQQQRPESIQKKVPKPVRTPPLWHNQVLNVRLQNATKTNDMPVSRSPDASWTGLTKLAVVTSKERIDSKKALYNNVIKRRLCCGSQLENLNKEIINKKNCSLTVLNKDTTRKYTELKNEYLNLCYQESTLRHQIALLHAEIYMMQNKKYHKTPATVKTITLDANTAQLHRRSNESPPVTDACPMHIFPCLKAPRPLITSQQRLNYEKQLEKNDKQFSVNRRTTSPAEKKVKHASGNSLPYITDRQSSHGICSIYSISPEIVTEPRKPFTLPERKVHKLVHRLPKVTSVTKTRSYMGF